MHRNCQTFFAHQNLEVVIPFPRLMISLLSTLICFDPFIFSLLFPFMLLTDLMGLSLVFFIFLRWSEAHSRNILMHKEKVPNVHKIVTKRSMVVYVNIFWREVMVCLPDKDKP